MVVSGSLVCEDQEWEDVEPVAQDDGPNPVVAIAYSEEFEDAMGYFRAVMKKKELSARALALTARVIALNAANYTVWQYRRKILEAMGDRGKGGEGGRSIDLAEERAYVKEVAYENAKNYQLWHHRRWVAERSGEESVQEELKFTEEILSMDTKNYHAWSHRQWVLKTLGGWEGELDFCGRLLEEDVWNNSAWNHRYFVVGESPLLPGRAALLDAEVAFCVAAIWRETENESAWRYLRGAFAGESRGEEGQKKKGLVENEEVRKVCMEVLMKDKKCVQGLIMLLDLVCEGFSPPAECRAMLDLPGEEGGLSAVGAKVCEVLEVCDKIRVKYWGMRREILLRARK